MHYFQNIFLFIVVMGALYLFIERKSTTREGIALTLAVLALIPLLNGGSLLVFEYARSENPTFSTGVITTRLSTTGEDGAKTIGSRWEYRRGRRKPLSIRTANGFRLHDRLARGLLTRTLDAWVVEYRYPCANKYGCTQLEFVDRSMWKVLKVGQAVSLRSADGYANSHRLIGNPAWPTGVAMVGIAATLLLIAAVVDGRLAMRRRKYVTVPAIVTSVDPVPAGGKLQWRVGFAYVDASGEARESADEIYVAGLRPGDSCLAVYPPGHPDLGSLQLKEPISV